MSAISDTQNLLIEKLEMFNRSERTIQRVCNQPAKEKNKENLLRPPLKDYSDQYF